MMQEKTITIKYEGYESKNELNALDSDLLEHALLAVKQSSAQFSNFHVGVAARLTDGSIHLASNKVHPLVSNAPYM